MENIEIKAIKEANREELIQLYKEAGWWLEENDINPAFVDEIVKKTFCFAGVFLNGKLIGMGRAISDGISDAYIQDVTVLKEFRGKGIGSKIIKFLVNYLKEKNISWIGLIGEPGTKNFYERLGFKEMEKYIPMIWKGE